MGIFSKIKRIFRNDVSVTDDKAWDSSTWSPKWAQSLSGENVTEYSALNYSAIYNAVSLISGTVATLPLRLLKKQDNSTIQVIKNPLYRVLHDQSNELMTAMTLRESMMGHILLWGNAYVEIVRDMMGRVVALYPITPNRVSVQYVNGELWYRINMTIEEDVILPRRSVLHVPGLGFDGLTGYSIVSMARRSIGLGMAMESFGSRYFGNGTHPGVIVSHPGKLSPEAHKNLEGSLVAAYSGLGQSHRLMLLEESMKLEKINIPNNDSQFLESRAFQIPEIARWFNLPPHKLKDLTRSSFNNIESEQISFVTDSILPWVVRLEQNYAMQLLSDSEKTIEGLYFKHVMEGLLRGSAKDRGEFYRTLWNLGAISINEIRGKEDMDPIDGGDEYFVPLNMVPLSQAGKQAEQPVIPELPEKPTDKKTTKSRQLLIPAESMRSGNETLM